MSSSFLPLLRLVIIRTLSLNFFIDALAIEIDPLFLMVKPRKLLLATLSTGQTDALVSLIYNWGEHNFLRSKGFEYLNQGKYDLAAEEFFSKDRGVVNINGKFSEGLYRRRQAELELWNDQT